jgi:hypothetical protein
MIVSLGELTAYLQNKANPNDTLPSETLWIKFARERTFETVEYRTADGNTLIHVYVDKDDALVGIEIFP